MGKVYIGACKVTWSLQAKLAGLHGFFNRALRSRRSPYSDVIQKVVFLPVVTPILSCISTQKSKINFCSPEAVQWSALGRSADEDRDRWVRKGDGSSSSASQACQWWWSWRKAGWRQGQHAQEKPRTTQRRVRSQGWIQGRSWWWWRQSKGA